MGDVGAVDEVAFLCSDSSSSLFKGIRESHDRRFSESVLPTLRFFPYNLASHSSTAGESLALRGGFVGPATNAGGMDADEAVDVVEIFDRSFVSSSLVFDRTLDEVDVECCSANGDGGAGKCGVFFIFKLIELAELLLDKLSKANSSSSSLITPGSASPRVCPP